ncbi:MAG: hypothetical protein ACFB00_02355 [Parvularculaceae bacterium]
MAVKDPDDRIGGYVASFLAFAGITALWAFLVRDDNFYSTMTIAGVSLPVITVAYLFTMPALGFMIGQWRYHERDGRRPLGFLGKGVARALNFVYSHLLIVLFTVAIVTDRFLAWNIDDAIRQIDDNLFDVASRFAPWVAAYLAGFNLGRAAGLRAWRRRRAALGLDDPVASLATMRPEKKRRRGADPRDRAEVTIHPGADERVFEEAHSDDPLTPRRSRDARGRGPAEAPPHVAEDDPAAPFQAFEPARAERDEPALEAEPPTTRRDARRSRNDGARRRRADPDRRSANRGRREPGLHAVDGPADPPRGGEHPNDASFYDRPIALERLR